MGRESEAGFAPTPLSQDQASAHPGTHPPVGEGSQPHVDQSPVHINTHDAQFYHENSDLGQSPILYHPTSQSTSESGKSSWNRFAIPTKNDSLSSGFPFHPRLYDLKVTHDEWYLFSSDIVNAAKMSVTDDFLAWTTGITAGTLTAPFLLVLGPVVGYYSGRTVHRKTLVKTVKEKLLQEGDLRSILRRWNEQTFMQKGFQAWLELPRDPGELHKEYLADETLEGKKPRDQKKVAKKAARRFRIIIVPNDDDAVSMTGQSNRGIAPPTISSPTETTADDHREILELHGRPSEPPAYSDSTGIEAASPVSPSGTTELPEPDSGITPPVQYQRPGGFTNT